METVTKNGDLSRFILKGSSMSERDAGFCSGGDEDDLDVDDVHSPTDASEDSVEVKVTLISPRNKNKRKCAEPRKVANDFTQSGPLKKRLRQEILNASTTEIDSTNLNPFRPWSLPTKASSPTNSTLFHPVYGYDPPTTQDEPLSLVKTSDNIKDVNIEKFNTSSSSSSNLSESHRYIDKDDVLDCVIKTKDFARLPFPVEEYHRVPPHPAIRTDSSLDQMSNRFHVNALLSEKDQKLFESSGHKATQSKEQRNYKNMTRERRIEANARERTRVHTISAAFDTLRKSIPAYSHNQKLSKLSVLRIACSYILTLSRVAGTDYSVDQSEPPLSNCVDLVSRTIQTEGKLRKKKDE